LAPGFGFAFGFGGDVLAALGFASVFFLDGVGIIERVLVRQYLKISNNLSAFHLIPLKSAGLS